MVSRPAAVGTARRGTADLDAVPRGGRDEDGWVRDLVSRCGFCVGPPDLGDETLETSGCRDLESSQRRVVGDEEGVREAGGK